MSKKAGPIEQLVREALSGNYAISAESIQQLRARSEKGIATLKWVFWVAIGLFNLMIWDPFTAPIPETLRWGVGLGALALAIVFPIFGIRRHRGYLYQLEDCTQGPKRRKADEAGRNYIDKVKKQGRFFVRAEYVALQGEAPP